MQSLALVWAPREADPKTRIWAQIWGAGGRWSQETSVGEWESNLGKRRETKSVSWWAGYSYGQLSLRPAGELWEDSAGHTLGVSSYRHTMKKRSQSIYPQLHLWLRAARRGVNALAFPACPALPCPRLRERAQAESQVLAGGSLSLILEKWAPRGCE